MKPFLILVALIAAAALAPATAIADSAGYSRGDAEAVFNAWPSGGDAIRAHGDLAEGAPALRGLRIRPFQPFAGTHVCSTDWHVVAVTLFTGGDSSYSHQQAVTDLAPLTMHFTLDGAPLTTTATPIKRATGTAQLFGLEEMYAQTTGAILAPDALSVGAHTIRLVMDNSLGPGVPEDFGDVTFFVDAPDTGACV